MITIAGGQDFFQVIRVLSLPCYISYGISTIGQTYHIVDDHKNRWFTEMLRMTWILWGCHDTIMRADLDRTKCDKTGQAF